MCVYVVVYVVVVVDDDDAVDAVIGVLALMVGKGEWILFRFLTSVT